MVRTRKLARSHEPEIVVADGDYVLRQGDLGTDMYVITAGRVRVTRHQDGDVVDLGERGRGEFFGVMSLLESLPRAADVQAIGEAWLLVITQGQLLVRLRRDPTFSLELLRQLSGEPSAAGLRVGGGVASPTREVTGLAGRPLTTVATGWTLVRCSGLDAGTRARQVPPKGSLWKIHPHP